MRFTLNINETELRVLRIAVAHAKATGSETYASCRCGFEILTALLEKIDKVAKIKEQGK